MDSNCCRLCGNPSMPKRDDSLLLMSLPETPPVPSVDISAVSESYNKGATAPLASFYFHTKLLKTPPRKALRLRNLIKNPTVLKELVPVFSYCCSKPAYCVWLAWSWSNYLCLICVLFGVQYASWMYHPTATFILNGAFCWTGYCC